MQGKFDSQVFEILNSCKVIMDISFEDLVNKIMISFHNVKCIFLDQLCLDKIEFYKHIEKNICKNNYDAFLKQIKKDILEFNDYNSKLLTDLYDILNFSASLLSRLKNLSKQQIVDENFKIYKLKNGSYNDAWSMNGRFGIFYDMHRKVVRLYNICYKDIKNSSEANRLYSDSINDTIIDLLNYCVFLIVALENQEFSLFNVKGNDLYE